MSLWMRSCGFMHTHLSPCLRKISFFCLAVFLIFLKKDRDGPCQFLIVESSLHGLVDTAEFHLVHSAYFTCGRPKKGWFYRWKIVNLRRNVSMVKSSISSFLRNVYPTVRVLRFTVLEVLSSLFFNSLLKIILTIQCVTWRREREMGIISVRAMKKIFVFAARYRRRFSLFFKM